MYQDQRFELRLSTRDLNVLDQKRGNVSRSRYLRWLIHHGPSSSVTEPDPEPMVEPITTDYF